jgi:hypothetical protein
MLVYDKLHSTQRHINCWKTDIYGRCKIKTSFIAIEEDGAWVGNHRRVRAPAIVVLILSRVF